MCKLILPVHCTHSLWGNHILCHITHTACGEPPQCMSCSVLFAIKRAVESARAEIQQQQVFVLRKSHYIYIFFEVKSALPHTVCNDLASTINAVFS